MVETVALSIVATALAILRILGHRSLVFQAVAHLFVGGLVGAWLLSRARLYLILAASLTVVEVACFLLFGR
jgi:hypothetical protein